MNKLTDESKAILEVLAAIQHEIWSRWMRWMFENGGYFTHDGGGDWIMLPEQVDRWQRQANTPYASLSEVEKKSDRVVVLESMGDIVDKLAALEAAQAERDRLREALRAVEWVYEYSFVCPWCNSNERDGHAPDCPRQAALGATDDNA